MFFLFCISYFEFRILYFRNLDGGVEAVELALLGVPLCLLNPLRQPLQEPHVDPVVVSLLSVQVLGIRIYSFVFGVECQVLNVWYVDPVVVRLGSGVRIYGFAFDV